MGFAVEQIEKVSRYTGVDTDLARRALEETGGSPLDAVIFLEQKGLTAQPVGGVWSTKWEKRPEPEEPAAVKRGKRNAVVLRPVAKDGRRRSYTSREVADAIRSLLRNCLSVTIDVWRGDDLLVGIPLVICVLLFLVAPYAMIPLTFVGLALRCRYHINGWDFSGEETINRTMDQVTETVAGWTDQVWSEMKDHHDRENRKK